MSKPDPLPSWNAGPARSAILDFVQKVTCKGPDFVPEDARVAVFDNDGTLWSEKPIYFQAAFVADRIRALAPDHPEWKQTQPFKAVLEGDVKALAAQGLKGIAQLVAATHAGMTVGAFDTLARGWMASARHPRFGCPYGSLVFQPMLELIGHLRQNGFRVFIVSAGGIDFMRACAYELYGVPPEQVIGSSGKTEFRHDGRTTSIVKLPEIDFVDDGPAKPLAIHRFIGRRPIFAAGNSDGDREMLQWTTLGRDTGLGLLVHHTDAEREWAYDRDSHVGRLDKALAEAPEQGWHVIDMKREWRRIHPSRP